MDTIDYNTTGESHFNVRSDLNLNIDSVDDPYDGIKYY